MTYFIPLTKVNTIGSRIISVNPSCIMYIKECPDKIWFDGKSEFRGATLLGMTNGDTFYVKERMLSIHDIVQKMENEAGRYSGWTGKFIDIMDEISQEGPDREKVTEEFWRDQ